MKTIFISCVILLALASGTTSWQDTTCQPDHDIYQIQTGIIQYRNQYQRQTCQDVELLYNLANKQLQIVASVISIETSYLGSYIDYSIKTNRKKLTNSFVVTLIINEKSTWTKISVSYIATSRDDLLMGSFLVDTSQTLPCLQDKDNYANSVVKASGVIANWRESLISGKIFSFISGIKSNKDTVSLVKIQSTRLNSSGIVETSIQLSSHLNVEYLQISYIIVAQNFPYHYGFDIQSSPYSLTVVNEISNSQIVQFIWKIQSNYISCEGSGCPKGCIEKQVCSKLGGNLLNNKCIFCPSHQIFSLDQCVSRCQQNQEWDGYDCACAKNTIQVGDRCFQCPPNSSPDQAKTNCNCNKNYIWSDWKVSCVSFQCPLNSLPVVAEKGVNCVCQKGFYKVNNLCEKQPLCPKDSVFDSTKGQCLCTKLGFVIKNGACVSGCAQGQIWSSYENKCICQQQFIRVGSTCVACPVNSILNSEKTKCICTSKFIWSDWKVACIPYDCPQDSKPVVDKNGVSCVCQNANTYLINGKCAECSKLSKWNGSKCQCIAGYIDFGGVCTSTCGKNQIWKDNKCVCIQSTIKLNGVCQSCPAYSKPNSQSTLCICQSGYKWDQKTYSCKPELQCPLNSYRNYLSECVCNEGFVKQNGNCIKKTDNNKCPPNSVWSTKNACCQCTKPNEYIIDNVCKQCPSKTVWSPQQMKCICAVGFNLVNGSCVACQLNKSYNGTHCKCNLGFYDNGYDCSPCHKTCGECSGPYENQCKSCIDVTFSLTDKGTCTKESKCPKGLYLKNSACQPCSTYCASCESESVCKTCISGFEMQSITYGNISATFCVQKCGDGKRYQLDCDDGNNNNYDGCSSDCKVEAGWTCTGGSSIQKSTCIKGTPDRTLLETTGTVHLYGRIVQGIRLSYIPDSLTANDCAECYNLLWVRVIRSDIVPGIRVNYLPKSRYQFLVEFEFHGTFSIPVFTVAIQINPQYSQYFNRRDMAQIQIKTIDPAVLALHDKEQTLVLGDVSFSKTQSKDSIGISNSLVEEIFKN